MTTKNKQSAENKVAAIETWRKPLQVPPRANAMRSFYQGKEENITQTATPEDQPATNIEEITQPTKIERKSRTQALPKKAENEKVEARQELLTLPIKTPKDKIDSEPQAADINKLTQEELSQKLGIEIDDLFDIHELLRGKSFDIYRTLMESADEKGRCKVTQPELMKRTGIKNRRTFYKHEDWLIGLKLLEKRHLPGDHKGVVYRVSQLSEVLPMTAEMLQKFQNRLGNIE